LKGIFLNAGRVTGTDIPPRRSRRSRTRFGSVRF